MSYVQIENPEIIDLASIQKIINVLNDHSDYLNVLVNAFGADFVPDFFASSVQGNFNIGSSLIVYGKTTIKPNNDFQRQNNDNLTYYAVEEPFATGVSFARPPRVLVSHDNTGGSAGGQLDIVVSTYNITTSSFTARAFRTGPNKNIGNDIDILYIAIGER
jgi:hypothetical protein